MITPAPVLTPMLRLVDEVIERRKFTLDDATPAEVAALWREVRRTADDRGIPSGSILDFAIGQARELQKRRSSLSDTQVFVAVSTFKFGLGLRDVETPEGVIWEIDANPRPLNELDFVLTLWANKKAQ